ncbi:AraC family transcriptional regulator [Clostridium vitabionis]|jgi:AraC-like DNA-binding protein|uniref:AraC family transcriptional regulator n=1 Tax=Clostridium vitabionis TaxID=2784388 RepID=UPI00188B9977|nr:AraC family transcriptional regulator [Clostridium vitabionis]
MLKNSYKAKARDLAALTVYNTGFQECPPGYQWGPGQRDHYLIHYIISGKGTYAENGQTYSLTAGEAFLARPGAVITYRADEGNPWNYCWVGFNGMDAGVILNSSLFFESPVIRVPFGNELQQKVSRMWELRGSGFASRIRMTGALYDFLALFAMENEQKDSHGYFDRAVDYIRKNYYSYTLSVSDIAGALYINRSYLYTVFKESSGMSPKEYLTKFRMQQAKNLLEHTDLGIAAISYSVGYADNLYFSRAFRSETGMSPSDYRKKLMI